MGRGSLSGTPPHCLSSDHFLTPIGLAVQDRRNSDRKGRRGPFRSQFRRSCTCCVSASRVFGANLDTRGPSSSHPCCALSMIQEIYHHKIKYVGHLHEPGNLASRFVDATRSPFMIQELQPRVTESISPGSWLRTSGSHSHRGCNSWITKNWAQIDLVTLDLLDHAIRGAT